MKRYVVRYGAMRYLGVMECSDESDAGFCHGVRVVARTPRGHELATVLCEATKERTAKLGDVQEKPVFVRRLTQEDEERLEQIKAHEGDDFDRCLRTVRRMNVDLSLVRVERVFGNERIIVYYVAEGRVDFRALVRALAAEFQTRIEMKQIGVRDETKLRDYVGDCGRELCCSTFLTSMPPVSMRMAKLQKATLDPTKVSGRCGRLKCCLRFEYETYNELQEQSPPLEASVMTPDGKGKVVAQELLAHKVVVSLESGAFSSFENKDVTVISNCMFRHDRHGQRYNNAGRKSGENGRSGKETGNDDQRL